MPSLIISSYDGVTKVAAIEPTPEMLAEAETFESMDEALKAVGEVLGTPAAEAQPEDAAVGPMSTEGPPMQDMEAEDDMQAGYSAAKRGQ